MEGVTHRRARRSLSPVTDGAALLASSSVASPAATTALAPPRRHVRIVEFRGKNKLEWEATEGEHCRTQPHRVPLTQSSDELRESLLWYLFMPKGYPASVTDDYAAYQFWDTVQALFSSVTGVLATRAVFKGVGVGDGEATAAAATVQWLCRDGVSSFGRIAFASAISKQLDSDSKRFRLVADVANDLAIFLEILTGYVAPGWFLPMVCLASALRTICGVCAGITKACLTFHFATAQNTADVASKDGNQETAVSLAGLVLGMLLARMPESLGLTWGLFFVFTALHLYSNYRGVRAVVLRLVNRHRLELSLRNAFPSPAEVSRMEGILFYTTRKIRLGAKLSDVLETTDDILNMAELRKPFKCRRTGAWVHVALQRGATPHDEVEAYTEAFYMLEHGLTEEQAEDKRRAVDPLKMLELRGWEMDNILLNSDEFRYEI